MVQNYKSYFHIKISGIKIKLKSILQLSKSHLSGHFSPFGFLLLVPSLLNFLSSPDVIRNFLYIKRQDAFFDNLSFMQKFISVDINPNSYLAIQYLICGFYPLKISVSLPVVHLRISSGRLDILSRLCTLSMTPQQADIRPVSFAGIPLLAPPKFDHRIKTHHRCPTPRDHLENDKIAV